MAEAWERRIAPALYDHDRPAGEVISLLETEAAGVQAAVREFSASQAQAIPELFKDTLTMLRERRAAYHEHGKATVGIPTGIPKLDDLLGGLQPGLHLLAAEPGAGKTTLACQIASHAARQGYPVIFVTFEETPERLVFKVLCNLGNLNQKTYWEGIGDPEKVAQVMSANAAALQPLKVVEGTARLTVPMLKAKALAALAHHKADRCLIVIDYLQKWAASRREFNDFRHIVGALVTELRELANRLGAPVLAISSQNRAGQGEAHLTSLKESGDLEYGADSALFLVANNKRPALSPNRAVDLRVMKNRYGDMDVTVPLLFQPDVCRMGEAAF
jgi:replicative DNA helicase